MNKYIRVGLSTFKLFRVKVFGRVTKFSFTLKNLIGNRTNFDFAKTAEISIGELFTTRNDVQITVRKDGKLKIGKNVFINRGSNIICHNEITIEDNVKMGPNILIYDHDHNYRKENWFLEYDYVTAPIKIGANTWIGGNTVILKGVEIGCNCVVGAGSVITKNIPDNSVVIQKRQTMAKKA